jgi:LAGLIDADG DNA endonuclease family
VTVRKGPKSPSVSEPSSFLLEVIFGLMLGDLSAERSQVNGDTRLRFYYSALRVNKLYIEYLYDLFIIYVKTGPRELERNHNKLTNQKNTVIYFSTLKFAFF